MGNYIDIDYIETISGRIFSDTTVPNTTQVEEYIKLAETEFESEVGDFTSSTNVDRVYGIRDGIYVNSLPLSSINYIKSSDGHPTNPTFNDAMDSTNYRIMSANTGKVRILNAIPKLEYEISYTSGYSSEEMPDDVKYLVYLYFMQYVFNETTLSTDGNFGDSQVIIDVDVYKEITGKSMYVDGMSALNNLINNAKKKLKKSFNTLWVY